MIKTKTNRGQIKRWIDFSTFVIRTGTSAEVNNKYISKFSLYDYILSHLSRSSLCTAWSGDLLVDEELYLPASVFVEGGTKNRTRKKTFDLYSAINTVVAHEDLCDLPFSINAEQYSKEFLQTLYISRKLDVLEVTKPFLARVQRKLRSTRNDGISLKTIIDNYAKGILDLENLPTIDVDITIVDPNDITVESVGLKSDGVTSLGAGDGLFMSVIIDGVTTPLYEGNPIPWGTEVTIEDRSFLGTKGIININGDYDNNFFESDGAFTSPITFVAKPIEDLGLFSERRGVGDNNTFPLF